MGTIFRRPERLRASITIPISEAMRAEIWQMADRVGWSASEIARQALQSGLPGVKRRVQRMAKRGADK